MIDMTEVEKGKYLYGTVTVGERGQIVIPKEAREHFHIKPGDKLLVAGDLKKGLAITKATVLKSVALKILGAVRGRRGEEESDEEG
jgi:AbrB family looped-hinge helix DNA binding protein